MRERKSTGWPMSQRKVQIMAKFPFLYKRKSVSNFIMAITAPKQCYCSKYRRGETGITEQRSSRTIHEKQNQASNLKRNFTDLFLSLYNYVVEM